MTSKTGAQVQAVRDFLFENAGGYWPFAPIMAATGLDRKVVRRACRWLKRQGDARFRNGLWNEDGEMVGSGYAAVDDGRGDQ